MKNYSKLVSQFSELILVMIFIPTLCFAKESVTNLTESKLVNDSSTVSQSYSFNKQPFDAIKLAGDFDVVAQVVHQPGTANVIVTASNSLLPYVKVYVKNKTLYILKRDSWDWESHTSKKTKVQVKVDNLELIQIHGSGDAYVDNIETSKFKAEIHGSGNITLQGNAKKTSLDIHGSGKIKAKNLIAETANVSISGSGHIVTNATQKININLHGSGTVEYYGTPQEIEQSFSGSGKIKAMK